MLTASEETEAFDVMETVGRLHAEGCRWEMDHPIAFGIKATYGIDRWGAFFVMVHGHAGHIIYCDRTNPVWKRVGSILSVMASETFFTYEDAEKAQAVFEGADPEDFEDEATRRVAQVIADFKPWLGASA